MDVTIDELLVADEPGAWVAAGFSVDDDGVCRVGEVRVRLLGPGRGKGVVGWSLRARADGFEGDLDGVPTSASDAPPAVPAQHPNGATRIDHVVVLSPDLTRTTAALAAIGAPPLRERDGELGGTPVRQVFHRFGDVILEVVGTPGQVASGPARIWGLTHAVTDIDATAAVLGASVGPVKDAVQPGRRITTLRNSELGMSVRTAFLSPHVSQRR